MIRQCLESKAEMIFNPSALKDIGIRPMSANNEEEVKDEAVIDHDKNDAVCELHNPLKGVNVWWILEFIPMVRHFPPIENGKEAPGSKDWKRKIQMNRFKARDIWPKEAGINVHASVQVRMNDPNANYEPKAKFPCQVNWVN